MLSAFEPIGRNLKINNVLVRSEKEDLYMRLGADYYPEHWDKSRWKTDAEMMVKANIKVIRMAEFAWSLFEPEDVV